MDKDLNAGRSKTCHPVIAWEQNANAFGSEFLASERERLLEKSE